jgi:hypothetical protein
MSRPRLAAQQMCHTHEHDTFKDIARMAAETYKVVEEEA